MKKIFLIEDDLVLQNVLKRKLELEGFSVRVAPDGEKALEALAEFQPDLILLDILMPKMDGIECLEKIKTNEKTRSTPVIIISNSGQPVEIEHLKNLGITDYLIKTDFEPSEVVEKIRTALGIKEPTTDTVSSLTDKKRKILIIEDDKFLRDLMEKKLTQSGYYVITAIDGEKGLRLLKTELPIDLILLDLLLPSISGWEVLEKITSDHKLKAIPVVLLTNLGEQSDIKKGIEMGAKDYIIKANFTPNEIVDKISACFSKKLK